MFGIDLRTLKIVWTVSLFALAVLLIYLVGGTIVVFALAVFLAHLLGPLAERVEAMIPTPHIKKSVSLAVVYGAILLIIAIAMIPVISLVGSQAAALAGQLPTTLEGDPLARLKLPVWLEPARERLTAVLHDRLDDFNANLIPMLQDVGSSMASFLGSLLALLLVPILSFFFLQDSKEIHDAIVDIVPGDYRELTEDILADLHRLLVQYIQALVILGIIVFLSFSLIFYLMGVQNPVLLASVAGLMEVIPVVGPLVSGGIILVVALLTGYGHLGWLAVFLIAFRLVQDYGINPHLMSSGAAIHPLLVLFGVLAGEQVAGIPGMFFSVPIIAGLRIIVVRMRRKSITKDVLIE
ncbi:MAG: AI-2E family transporter [Acidobacteriota bacterium]